MVTAVVTVVGASARDVNGEVVNEVGACDVVEVIKASVVVNDGEVLANVEEEVDDVRSSEVVSSPTAAPPNLAKGGVKFGKARPDSRGRIWADTSGPHSNQPVKTNCMPFISIRKSLDGGKAEMEPK